LNLTITTDELVGLQKFFPKEILMTNMFEDQKQFMQACGQTTDIENIAQYKLYHSLMKEEMQELEDSTTKEDDVDALIDILVVTIGALHSIGVDAQGAWDEVYRSNMAKVDAGTGVVLRREDGKILKPEGWQPPNLKQYLR
jgi:predicted HAD superfamily Cof-like phosphohydrolase